MELHEELVFKASKGPKLEIEIPEDAAQDKLTLGLKGAFNKALATALGVEWLFASDTVGNPGLKDCTLKSDIAFSDVELKLIAESGDVNTFYPEKIHTFRCFASGGGGLGVQCRIDINGHLDEILDFFRNHRSSGFEFRIKSRQGELFDGGTRVDMSGDEPDADDPTADSSDPAPVIDFPDRSHENRPKGGRRGRKAAALHEPDEWIAHASEVYAADDGSDPVVEQEVEEAIIQ